MNGILFAPALFPTPVSLVKPVSLVRKHPRNRAALDGNVLEDLLMMWRARGNADTFHYSGQRKRFTEFVEFRVDDADELRFCEDCAIALHEYDTHDHGDKTYCEGCYDEYSTCDSCHSLVSNEDLNSVRGDDIVCDYCLREHYSCCDHCSVYVADDDTTSINERTVCDRCRRRHYMYCEDCGEHYHPDYESHSHDEGGCNCEPPAGVRFTVRNGTECLDNDDRVTVTLPSGVIDEQGIERILSKLCSVVDYYVACVVRDLDHRWQTKEGNFTKRLSRAVYKKNGTKLDPAMVSAIGNIAREHASSTAEFHIEVTRELNLPAEEFANEESCWWSESEHYHQSRCALKSNGGYGLRTFGGYMNGYVNGRAWVMPLKQTESGALTPTFDTEAPAAFVVFNGYDELSGYVAPRIVAQMAGMTYRKVTFTCSPMYINGDSGYLVAPEDLAAGYTDGYLNLSVVRHSHLYGHEQRAAQFRTTTDPVPTHPISEVTHV